MSELRDWIGNRPTRMDNAERWQSWWEGRPDALKDVQPDAIALQGEPMALAEWREAYDTPEGDSIYQLLERTPTRLTRMVWRILRALATAPPEAIALQGEALRLVRKWQLRARGDHGGDWEKSGGLAMAEALLPAIVLDPGAVVPLLRAALEWLDSDQGSEAEHNAAVKLIEARDALTPEWKAVVE